MQVKLYEESQRITQKWVWAIILLSTIPALGIFIYGFVEQIINKKEFGTNPVSDTSMLILAPIVILIIFCLILLAYKTCLFTQIDDEGVRYKFFPFHLKFISIGWEQISKAYTRQYNPLKEYGGWGIKWSSTNAAYNLFGNYGLQLVLKNRKKILIGTQKPDELRSFLISINRYRE